jgi:1-acyl-sn-glycerol-3-phosphate acyltransferase
MAAFETKYPAFVENTKQLEDQFGFDIDALARIEPLLKFLHQIWWRVEIKGFDRLPKTGPALITGNTSGIVPWAGLMLIYTLLAKVENPRRVNIAIDMDGIEDQRLYNFLTEIGFVPWSADNAKKLLSQGQIVAVFPEGAAASMSKSFWMRNRVCEFDWTKFLPAAEQGVPIFPVSVLGVDECNPTLVNLDGMARFLGWKAFPVSPFFPILPFPFNLATLPTPWEMTILPANDYKPAKAREEQQRLAKEQAFLCEGDVQAEINRRLRIRHR